MATILLAEDDESLRSFLARALAKAGHDVTAVGDGAAALEQLNEAGYDLLLSDIVMPGMDGIDLSRRAGKLQPGIKVMFITGFAAVALNARNNAPEGAQVLSKPFHLRDLVGAVERFLAGADVQPEAQS